jgi:predicted O-methyltransferase YrrM
VVIELGTGTGISSLYLGMACPRSQVLSCEGSPALARLAASNIAEMSLPNIEVSDALFGDWLPGVLDRVQGDVLVFIDGDHREESLQRYCSLILASGLGKIVLVLDDIRWSPEMYRAWKRLSVPGTSGRGFEFHNTGILLSGFDF